MEKLKKKEREIPQKSFIMNKSIETINRRLDVGAWEMLNGSKIRNDP